MKLYSARDRQNNLKSPAIKSKIKKKLKDHEELRI